MPVPMHVLMRFMVAPTVPEPARGAVAGSSASALSSPSPNIFLRIPDHSKGKSS